MKSFGCMPAGRTPEASRTLTVSCPGILPSPLRDKVGAFDHDRFRGYVSVHFRSGLRPPCLRFAVAVAGHHARLGTRLLVPYELTLDYSCEESGGSRAPMMR